MAHSTTSTHSTTNSSISNTPSSSLCQCISSSRVFRAAHRLPLRHRLVGHSRFRCAITLSLSLSLLNAHHRLHSQRIASHHRTSFPFICSQSPTHTPKQSAATMPNQTANPLCATSPTPFACTPSHASAISSSVASTTRSSRICCVRKRRLSADTSLMGESLVFVGAVMAIAHFVSVQFLSLSRAAPVMRPPTQIRRTASSAINKCPEKWRTKIGVCANRQCDTVGARRHSSSEWRPIAEP